MAIRIAINGFGRIGRNVLRAAWKQGDFEFVHINDLTSADMLAYLLRREAEAWLRARGAPMWRDNELTVERVSADIGAGLVFVVDCDGSSVAVQDADAATTGAWRID